MFNSLFNISKKIYKKIIPKIARSNGNSDTETKRKILYNVIMKDENLQKIGIFETVKGIVDGHVATRSLDFIYSEIASFIINVGHPQWARSYFKNSLDISFSPYAYSLYLQGLLVDPYCSDDFMYQEAVKFNQFYSHVKRYEYHPNKLDPNKKLNIGYLCHFFHNSVSKSLLLPFLKEHNRDRVNVYCYSDASPEEVSDDVRECATIWRETKDLDDSQLTELVREDEIDILLELNGHAFTNRYGVIARKASPVQINYYNQSATTGISAFDYVLVGEDIVLDQSKYAEQIYQMKGVQGIAIFPDSFPDVAPSPCQNKDYVVFGSFGAAHKINADVIRLWCRILHEMPNAKLFMKAGVFTHDAYVSVYKRLFAQGGIDLNRIRFEGFSEHFDMLKLYGDVDIALDSFPHAAGTTTMEALWQGVPVISLCNTDRYCTQNGRIVLTAVGHPELVARTEEEYIAKAIALASDKNRLNDYRMNLRNDFKKSTLSDVKSFVSRLEDSYEQMWKKYCKDHAH
jgi:predicted O-linked N-acetylglucosamine transferase (SPINDLY family)